jgi:phosphotriesterase-related protein
VQTVLGPVLVADLGMTLMHEHLLCDWTARAGTTGAPAEGDDWLLPVDASIAWLLTEDPGLRRDNGLLDDVATAVEELGRFSDAGGRTVVECTNGDIGRDPLGLQEISQRSGVQVVMGSGWYVHAFHDRARGAASADALAEGMLTEFAQGVADTGVRPGVIGEIGVSPEFTEAERTALRAACRAQRQVGVPLMIHLPGWQRHGAEVLRIVLDEEAVAPQAVVLCHMDPSGDDPAYQHSLADRGVWLEFDMVGMSTYYAGEGQSPSPDQTAAAVAALVRHGLGDRILLSHDVSTKSMWTRNGGNGLGFVPRLFLPRLVRHGVAPEAAAGLLTANPASVFREAAGPARP